MGYISIAIHPVNRHCREQIKDIDKRINNYFEEIQASIERIGKIDCHTYDKGNKYLYEKINNHDKGKGNVEIFKDQKMERQIASTYQNIIGKVKGDLDKTIDKREINVDELRKAHDSNEFCNLGNKIYHWIYITTNIFYIKRESYKAIY